MRMAAAMTMKTSGPRNVRRCPPHQSIGPLPGLLPGADSPDWSGAAVATCAMNPPCASDGRRRGGASIPASTARRLVIGQHNPDPAPGQEEKWDMAGTFRHVTNHRPIEDEKDQPRVSTMARWTRGRVMGAPSGWAGCCAKPE